MLDTNAPIAISQPVGPETPFRAFDSDVNFRNWLDATRVGMTTLLKEAEQAVKDRDNVINQRGSRIKEVEMRLEAVTEERNALIRDGFTLRAEARDAVAYRDELIKERDGKLLRYERLLALATEEKHKGIKDRRVIQKNAEEIVARRDREIREQRSTIEALEARLAAVTDRKNVMASEQSSVLAMLDCPLCLETMTLPSIVGQCGHTLCKKCIGECKKKPKVTCPICRAPFCRRPPLNFTLNAVAEVVVKGTK